jgi:hypothetical protein
MKWSVCKYGCGMIILPTDYVLGIIMSNDPDYHLFEIVRSFDNKDIALEYLTELVLADNLIHKALQ